jgi:hypothetical protein
MTDVGRCFFIWSSFISEETGVAKKRQDRQLPVLILKPSEFVSFSRGNYFVFFRGVRILPLS